MEQQSKTQVLGVKKRSRKLFIISSFSTVTFTDWRDSVSAIQRTNERRTGSEARMASDVVINPLRNTVVSR